MCRSEKLAERKNMTKPRPNTHICNGYQNGAVQADNTWKSFCEELSAETTLTQFWQFYQHMEGNDRTKTTPDLENTNRARLETNEEKGQALLGRFIPQSNQSRKKRSMHRLISTEHLHKVAPTMNSQRRNSTKPLEEAGRIQNLVRIRFDTQISRS